MLAIKKTLSYVTIFSLMFSNIALAGKDLAGLDQEAEALLTTIRPNTFSSTKHIDALHIYESGEIIAQDLDGNRSSVKPYNQPQEVKDAIQHGHLMSLLALFNLYVTKPGEELKIQLMGGLKGGMMRGGGSPRGNDSIPKCTGSNDTNCRDDRGLRITITPNYTTDVSGGGAHDGYDGYHNNGSGGGNSNTQSLGDTSEHGKIGELADYHIKNSGFPQFAKLHPVLKEEVLLKANYLWTHASPFVYPPSTEHLNNALVQVVYMPPQWEVLGWAKEQESLTYFKNVPKQYEADIVKQAGHHALRNNAELKNITSLIAGYDQVMTGKLQYVFDYHKQTTKAAIYQDLPPEYEATLIREALGNMKSRNAEFKSPDTAPLTESFRYHRTLGEALLKGYGHAVDDLLCATLGSCPAHANYVQLGMEIFKQAPRAVTWVGLSASTMWNGKVKNFVTDAVDWIRPLLFSSPVEELAVNLSIYKTFGPSLSKSIFDNPAAFGQARKLLNDAEIPTKSDRELEIVDAVGGQQIDPDHEPEGDKHGDEFHKRAVERAQTLNKKVLDTDKALDEAINFLGKGYKDMGNSRFLSADKMRQIRMADKDILGHHAGGRHINFDVLTRNPLNPNKLKYIDKIHVYIK